MDPPFSLAGNRFDQSTYKGRILGFLDVVDPRLLLCDDEELAASQKLLEQFKEGATPAGTTEQQLWAAKKTVESIVHPTLGEPIPLPLRMAAFVPMNVPAIAGMLSTTSVPGQLFWQWWNQTYNSALNYANRGGGTVTTQELATGYGLAVGSACSLAWALKWAAANGPPLVQKLGTKPRAIPYVTVAMAGAANIYFSRRVEIEQGVAVCLDDGTEVGVSQEAAKQGVLQTVLSRGLFLPLPVLVLPPLLMGGLGKAGLPVTGRMKLPMELICITVCLTAALPACIAAFPQRLELDTDSLEPRFHALTDASGGKVAKLYSNKGL